MDQFDAMRMAAAALYGNRGKDYGYGIRNDGTFKGPGFMGELKTPKGDVATELSIGVELEGQEVEIPLLVPTLSKKQVDHLLNDGKATKDIVDKAVDHAKKRMKQGKSPFYGAEDED
jgi:hypothetical protein